MNSDSDILGSILSRQFAPPQRDAFASPTVASQALDQALSLVRREEDIDHSPKALNFSAHVPGGADQCVELLEVSDEYTAAVAAIAPAIEEVREKAEYLRKEMDHFGDGTATYKTVDAVNHAREVAATLASKPRQFVHPVTINVSLSLWESAKDEIGAWVSAQEGHLPPEQFEQLKADFYFRSSRDYTVAYERGTESSAIEIGRAITYLKQLRDDPSES